MNRTDRLLAIVLEVQARGAARAHDLAEHFETSKRTIYRDIEVLCAAGLPVPFGKVFEVARPDGRKLTPIG